MISAAALAGNIDFYQQRLQAGIEAFRAKRLQKAFQAAPKRDPKNPMSSMELAREVANRGDHNSRPDASQNRIR